MNLYMDSTNSKLIERHDNHLLSVFGLLVRTISILFIAWVLVLFVLPKGLESKPIFSLTSNDIFGIIVSFICGVLLVKWLFRFPKKHEYKQWGQVGLIGLGFVLLFLAWGYISNL